jgi:hypothetical protein
VQSGIGVLTKPFSRVKHRGASWLVADINRLTGAIEME